LAEFIPLWEVRTLMTDALRVVNDVDERAPPGLHAGFAAHQASSATAADPPWPGLNARA
jgi:hypothetical protein